MSLQSDVAVLQNRINDLIELVESLVDSGVDQGDIDDINSRISALTGRVVALEALTADHSNTLIIQRGMIEQNSEDILTLRDQLLDLSERLEIIESALIFGPKTISVATTGAVVAGEHYNNLYDAIEYVNNHVVIGGTVTITVANGTYNHVEPLSLKDNEQAYYIRVVGNNNSPSSVVLNFNNCNGLELVNCSNGFSISGLTLNGNGGGNSNAGISLSYSNIVFNRMVVNNFKTGIYCVDNSTVKSITSGTSVNSAFTACSSYGIFCSQNSIVEIYNSEFKNSSIIANSNGIHCRGNSAIIMDNITIENHDFAVYVFDGSAVRENGTNGNTFLCTAGRGQTGISAFSGRYSSNNTTKATSITGFVNGLLARANGAITVDKGVTVNNCNTGVVSILLGSIDADGITVTNSSVYGFNAEKAGAVTAMGVTTSGNSVDFNGISGEFNDDSGVLFYE